MELAHGSPDHLHQLLALLHQVTLEQPLQAGVGCKEVLVEKLRCLGGNRQSLFPGILNQLNRLRFHPFNLE